MNQGSQEAMAFNCFAL